MKAREEIILMIIDSGLITDKYDKNIFLTLLSQVELEEKMRTIENLKNEP